MKTILFSTLALILFSCGNNSSCWYYNKCDSGCLEKAGGEYYCSHCCIAKSQKPEGWEEADKKNKETPVQISDEELQELKPVN